MAICIVPDVDYGYETIDRWVKADAAFHPNTRREALQLRRLFGFPFGLSYMSPFLTAHMHTIADLVTREMPSRDRYSKLMAPS